MSLSAFLFLGFHVIDATIAKIKRWFSKLDSLSVPKARSDFRSKWLLLQSLHIFLFAEFSMQSVHESGFCGIQCNLIQLYFNMLVAFLKNPLQRFDETVQQ